MSEAKDGKRKNAFLVRIYDEPTLQNLDDLMKSGSFDSRNELLSMSVRIGAETLLGRFTAAKAISDAVEPKKEFSAQLNAIEKRIKDNSRKSDELFVIMSMIETMVTTLYNVEIAHIRGEEVSGELMDSGYFSDLPENLQRVREEILPKN